MLWHEFGKPMGEGTLWGEGKLLVQSGQRFCLWYHDTGAEPECVFFNHPTSLTAQPRPTDLHVLLHTRVRVTAICHKGCTSTQSDIAKQNKTAPCVPSLFKCPSDSILELELLRVLYLFIASRPIRLFIIGFYTTLRLYLVLKSMILFFLGLCETTVSRIHQLIQGICIFHFISLECFIPHPSTVPKGMRFKPLEIWSRGKRNRVAGVTGCTGKVVFSEISSNLHLQGLLYWPLVHVFTWWPGISAFIHCLKIYISNWNYLTFSFFHVNLLPPLDCKYLKVRENNWLIKNNFPIS